MRGGGTFTNVAVLNWDGVGYIPGYIRQHPTSSFVGHTLCRAGLHFFVCFFTSGLNSSARRQKTPA